MKPSRTVMHRFVAESISTLGTGFVDVSTNKKYAQPLFGELIGLVYRLLCMAIVEDRCTSQTREGTQLFYAVQKSNAWKELGIYMDVYCSRMDDRSARRLWSTSVFPYLLSNQCDDEALRSVVQNTIHFIQEESIHAKDLGWTYEALLSYQARIQNGVFSLQKTELSKQKLTGAHYTPDELIDCVLRQALNPVLKQREIEEKREIRVCDPSCGSGLFLLDAALMIASKYSDGDHEDRDQQALCDVVNFCVYGVDINPTSVDVCILSLWFAVGMSWDTLGVLDTHIRQGNSVLDEDLFYERFGDEPKEMTFFSWEEAFPLVFDRENPGFDCMIGNPPWISFSGRHAHPITVQEKRIYQSLYDGFAGWLTLHSLFVEQGLYRTRENGFLGLILPRQLAELSGYAAIRNVVRQHSTVQEPLSDFGEGAFGGVEQPSFALVVQKESGNQARIDPFILQTSCAYQKIIDSYMSRLECCTKPPKDSFRDIGVHTGNCSKQLISKVRQKGHVPVYEGKNIHPFRLDTANRWLYLEYEKKEGEYYTIRSLEDYERVRILIRQTGNRPVASKHIPKSFFRNSVLACYGMEQWSDDQTISWLNSTIIAFFYINSIPEARQQTFPQVKIGHLRNLPVPSGSIDSFLDQGLMDDERHVWQDRQVSSAFGFSSIEHTLLCALYAFQCKKQRYDALQAKPKKTVQRQLQYDQLVADIEELHNTIENLLLHVDLMKDQ
ncbi:MAG: hypothetical protein CL916_00515 [Deltaproteobacteria bacterium]|nr:hypothetical protein [Deltaproteobacteria bacterium]